MGIDADFVRLSQGNSRINVKIKSAEETELNGQGPHIDDESLAKLFEKLNELKDGDTLILAGSIPNSLPSDIYEKILQYLSDRKIKAVVDATKDLLLNVLKYHPFLIKPNNHELGEIFGKALTSDSEIAEYAAKLQDMGARNVLVSMAGDGALLLDEHGNIHKCGVCKGTVKNSVGAGDSMVAGFTAGSLEGDYDYALRLGTACGGATAFSDGLAKKELIFELIKQL
jgi:1-phosphofructokinase